MGPSLGVFVLVTPLLAEYGSSSWSWIGGPIASLILLILGDTTSARVAWRTFARHPGWVSVASASKTDSREGRLGSAAVGIPSADRLEAETELGRDRLAVEPAG